MDVTEAGGGAPTCLAEGVMPCCTTMRARVMFSSCMRWQYTLMVLIPTLGSSADRAHCHTRPGPAPPPARRTLPASSSAGRPGSPRGALPGVWG